jgi:peptide/nickel transport system substrate-binding protein
VPVSSRPELPSGTVTFLFTDIEGSTRLLRQLGERYADALTDHQRILRDAFAEHGGREIDTQGDSFFVAFRRARDAVSAALSAQRALSGHSWPADTRLRVRMAIHTGEPIVGEERYVGLGVHRAARICAAGHGGQVLVSQTTRELLRDDPPPDVSLRDLGEHPLKDLDEPERLYQLVAPGLEADFPPLGSTAPAPFAGREAELAAEAAQELGHSGHRPSRRLALAGAAAVALVAAAVGVVLTQGGGNTASASGKVAANTVGVIDARSGRIRSQIPVGAAPGGVTYGDGAIWVANRDDNSVSRIDPGSNGVRQTIAVGGGPAGIAVSGNAVWVANGLDGTVSRIDPTTNQVVQTIPVGNGPNGVAFGDGAVWVANSADGTVTRIDPATGRVTRTLPAVVGATGIAVAFQRIWVVSESTGSLAELDPGSGAVLARIGVGVDPDAVSAGAGAVWVANRADGTVSKIDPRSGSVAATIQVGRSPDGIAAGPGGVWVANGADGTLTHIDPARGAVRTVRLTNPPQGLALAPDGVYVAVRSSGLEHRGGVLRVTSDQPDFIDPALAYFPASWSILSMTNDGLVAFRRVGGAEGAQLVPDLAMSLPAASGGGTTYTFQLRPGIRYSDGKLVQPDDFRRGLERVFEVRPTSGGAQIYRGIMGAAQCRAGRPCNLTRGIAVDRAARTVTFRLTAPDPDFLTKLALPFAYAVPGHTAGHNIGMHPLPATGPYLIAAYERKQKLMRLVRNPRFRQWSADAQPRGYPDSIVWSWRLTGSLAAEAREVERGAADLAPSFVPGFTKQQLELLAIRDAGRLHMSTTEATNYFFLNTRVPPFDDVRVRRAVNYAFDRQQFVGLLGRGYAPTCQILPPNSPAYRRTCPYASGGAPRLDEARRLVRASRTAGFRITVWAPTEIPVQGRYMVSLLDSLGYRARLKSVPFGNFGPHDYFAKVLDSRLRVQTGYYGWVADFPSAGSFLSEEFSCASFVPASPQGNQDPTGWCDPSLDAEMRHAAAVQATDPPASGLLWQRIEARLLAQAIVVPTSNKQEVDLVSKRVGNYQYHPQWGALVDQLWVK